MGDFTQFQEPVWDRFFDFIFECDEDLNRAEVQEELRRRGIDVTRAVNKVQQRSAPPRRGRSSRRRERAVWVFLPEPGEFPSPTLGAVSRSSSGGSPSSFRAKPRPPSSGNSKPRRVRRISSPSSKMRTYSTPSRRIQTMFEPKPSKILAAGRAMQLWTLYGFRSPAELVIEDLCSPSGSLSWKHRSSRLMPVSSGRVRGGLCA